MGHQHHVRTDLGQVNSAGRHRCSLHTGDHVKDGNRAGIRGPEGCVALSGNRHHSEARLPLLQFAHPSGKRQEGRRRWIRVVKEIARQNDQIRRNLNHFPKRLLEGLS